MWWRSVCTLAVALPLAACGFHPLYGPRSALGYDPTLASIDVHTAADRFGQMTTEEVREQLNPRGVDVAQRYDLSLKIQVVRTNLGIAATNTASRGELLATATLALAARGKETPLLQDTIQTTTAFNLSNDAYAASVAEDNARQQAAADLGREIALRVQLFIERQARQGT